MPLKDETPKGAQTTRPTDPTFTDRASAKAPKVDRIAGAIFLGGRWLAADGSPLTDKESQQAHRAQDAKDAETRRKAMLGGAE